MPLLQGHQEEVTQSVFIKNESHLLSGSLDRTLRLWDLQTCEEVKTISTKVRVVSMAINQFFTAIGGEMGEIIVYHTEAILDLNNNSNKIEIDDKMYASNQPESN